MPLAQHPPLLLLGRRTSTAAEHAPGHEPVPNEVAHVLLVSFLRASNDAGA
jgi:hypothetical protein